MKQNVYYASLFSALFVVTAAALQVQSVSNWDAQLTLATYDFLHSQLATTILVIVTDYAIATAISIFLVALFIHIRHTLTTAVVFVISTGALALVAEVLKALIQRSRPFTVLNQVVYLGAQIPPGFSFPSMHSALAFFAAYFMTKVLRLTKLEKLIVYGLALLVAISRIYLGAHYVGDTVAGALLGMAAGEVALLVCKYLQTRQSQR